MGQLIIPSISGTVSIQPVIQPVTDERKTVWFYELMAIISVHGKPVPTSSFVRALENDADLRGIMALDWHMFGIGLDALDRHQDWSLSFNWSPRDLFNPDLLDKVGARLSEVREAAGRLRLEYTEVYNQEIKPIDIATATSFGEMLHRNGAEVIFDDGGNGIFRRLRRFEPLNPDAIKIAKPVVDSFMHGHHQMFRRVMQFAKEWNVPVIAEGIESQEILDTLQRAGVKYFQGFHIGRPQPLENMQPV